MATAKRKSGLKRAAPKKRATLRWIQGEPPPLEEVLEKMVERAAKFNAEKVKQEDLASAGGAPDDAD